MMRHVFMTFHDFPNRSAPCEPASNPTNPYTCHFLDFSGICREHRSEMIRNCSSVYLSVGIQKAQVYTTTYWCLVGNGWEWGNGMIITSDYGSFPHSLLSTSETMTVRISLTKEAVSFRRLLWVIHEEEDFLGVRRMRTGRRTYAKSCNFQKPQRGILCTTKPSTGECWWYSFIDTL